MLAAMKRRIFFDANNSCSVFFMMRNVSVVKTKIFIVTMMLFLGRGEKLRMLMLMTKIVTMMTLGRIAELA